MEGVLARRATEADVPGIQRVADAAWHAAYDDILGPETVDEVLSEWYTDEAVADGVDHDAQDFFVAVRDGEGERGDGSGGAVVGYAHAGPHPPRQVHRLYRLYVHPDEWRSGVGRQLLAEVEQALYDRDVRAYEAEVLADNDVGVSFYGSTGFERVAETETELAGTTATAYIYRKPL